MAKLSDRAREAYLKQRPDRRIIDVQKQTAPEPSAPPEAISPDLGSSMTADSAIRSGSADKLAYLREKFLGKGTASVAADTTSNGPVRPARRHSTFVVTDAGGQVKVDVVDPETGEIEMEQG